MTNPLDLWLKTADVGDAEFGARIGRDRSIVSKLRRDVLRPTLDVAAAIEKHTGGAVPMQSWAVCLNGDHLEGVDRGLPAHPDNNASEVDASSSGNAGDLSTRVAA